MSRAIYINDVECMEAEHRAINAYIDRDLQIAAAKFLGISLKEYQDFERDMAIDTLTTSPEDIMEMYAEYCQEYDIPLEQPIDYIGVEKTGW